MPDPTKADPAATDPYLPPQGEVVAPPRTKRDLGVHLMGFFCFSFSLVAAVYFTLEVIRQWDWIPVGFAVIFASFLYPAGRMMVTGRFVGRSFKNLT